MTSYFFDYLKYIGIKFLDKKRRIKMGLFTGKTLMITGGTGSFGNVVLNRFLKTDIGEIRVFSRDEKKQDDMRHDFQARMPEVADKIKFYIGDVRDLQSCKNAMHGVDYIFHAAALKQVPSCEFFPMEAVKTNIIGTDNVLTAAIEEGVEDIAVRLRSAVLDMVTLCVLEDQSFLYGLTRLRQVTLSQLLNLI